MSSAGDISVAVVVPVRNRRHLLTSCIRSALDQVPPPHEIIVVDDGSTDGSGDLAAEVDERVRVLRRPHRGRSAARNTGIHAAGSTWIAFLDSDDRWLPGHLARQLEVIDLQPQSEVVVGHIQAVDERSAPDPSVTDDHRAALEQLAAQHASPRRLVERPGILTSAVMVRRSALLAVGGFDEGIDGNEDHDLWLRLAMGRRYAFVPWPPIAEYRVHAGNTDAEAMANGTVAMALKHGSDRRLDRSCRAALQLNAARANATLNRPGLAVAALGRAGATDPRSLLRLSAVRVMLATARRAWRGRMRR